ncbi:hypothetical protein AYI69_g991 [Smittium culicis]|uniref:Uncharacterized protein n=1 Tax=Smittium culicis TaxID=133412 RepID=A0A1R1YRI9_9FUNG|nr:hypothetical protein AYI69_g991 [Smittium culicis]
MNSTEIRGSIWEEFDKMGVSEAEFEKIMAENGIFDQIDKLFAVKKVLSLGELRKKKKIKEKKEISVLNAKRSHNISKNH